MCEIRGELIKKKQNVLNPHIIMASCNLSPVIILLVKNIRYNKISNEFISFTQGFFRVDILDQIVLCFKGLSWAL